jgi:hypothetical protein
MLFLKATSFTRIQSEWMMVLSAVRLWLRCCAGTHEGMRGCVWPVANTTRLLRNTRPVDR